MLHNEIGLVLRAMQSKECGRIRSDPLHWLRKKGFEQRNRLYCRLRAKKSFHAFCLKMNNNENKLAGFCAASLLISTLIELAFCNLESAWELPSVAFVVLALPTTFFVYQAKRWAYWCALAFSALLIAMAVHFVLITPALYASSLLSLEESPQIVTFISAVLLITKKQNTPSDRTR